MFIQHPTLLRSISLVSLLIFAALLSAHSAYAPAPEKAEKVRIDGLSWNQDNQQFIVDLSVMFGMASAGESANFMVTTTLMFDADGDTIELTKEIAIQKVDGAEKDADGFVAIQPTSILWDRNGGTFSGTVSIIASSQVKSPSGVLVGDGPTTRSFDGIVVIGKTKTVEILVLRDPEGGIPAYYAECSVYFSGDVQIIREQADINGVIIVELPSEATKVNRGWCFQPDHHLFGCVPKVVLDDVLTRITVIAPPANPPNEFPDTWCA